MYRNIHLITLMYIFRHYITIFIIYQGGIMATLKIIDRKDKFLIEVDGSKVPYVTTYELTRKPSGTVLLHLALAMSEVEIEVESDQITTTK